MDLCVSRTTERLGCSQYREPTPFVCAHTGELDRGSTKIRIRREAAEAEREEPAKPHTRPVPLTCPPYCALLLSTA